jgi:hypothetical protein
MPYRPKNRTNPRLNRSRFIQFKHRWPWIDWSDRANPRVIHRPGDIIHGSRANYCVGRRGNFIRIRFDAPVAAKPFAAAIAAKGAA